jgi:hypothetical protein
MFKSIFEDLADGQVITIYKAADGWLSQWRCRFKIKFKKAHGENSADVVNAEQLKFRKLPDLLEKFGADYICNACQTVYLFCCAVLEGSLSYRHSTQPGSEKAMNYVTVVLLDLQCCRIIVNSAQCIDLVSEFRSLS